MAGNATIGALRVVLGLDSAQFESGLKKSSGGLAAFAKTAAISGAAIGAALVAAGTALAVAVKGQLNAADELGKTAQKVGVGVESLSRLKYAADLSDVSLEGLSGGLKKLGVNLNDVATGGSGKAAEAMATLGISARDTNGQLKSSDVVLAEVAGKFAGMEDGAQKTALAVALFGKSGSDLIPLLNSGADGLKAMGDEAAQLGLVIDTQTAKSAEQFNDNLTRLKAVGTGLTTQLASSLAPALASISAALVNTAKNGDVMRGVGLLLSGVLRTLATAGVIVGAEFANTGRAVGATAAAIMAVVRGDFQGAFNALKSATVANAQQFATTAGAIKQIWTDTGAAVKASAPRVSSDLAAPMTQGAAKVAKAAKEIKSEAEKAGEALRQYIKTSNESLANRGLSSDEVNVKEAQAKASEALGLGLAFEAAQLLRIADGYAEVKVEAVDAVRVQGSFIDGIEGLGDQGKQTFEDLADGFYDIGRAVDDVFYGVKNNDWVGAFSGLTRALDKVKLAFSAAGTAQDKYAALAGVGQAVGGAIGGKGGAALSGAAGGAATGFALGGPIGAGIGAVVGGLAGFFGASKAKKAAKKEAAARAKAEAERAALEEANTKRALEIALLRASRDAVAARAAEEEDLLKTLSPANAELQKQIFALERQAEAAAVATALADQQAALEREIAEATGDSTVALKQFRDDALAELPASLRGAKQALFDFLDAQAAAAERLAVAEGLVATARDDLAASYDAEKSALEDVRDRFADLADSLADLGRELRTGDLAGLDPKRQRAVDRANFERVSALAAGGDAAALAQLPDAVRAFRASSLAGAPDARAAQADLAAMRRSVAAAEIAARNQVSLAERQLAALNTQVAGLLELKSAVLTVSDAIGQLNGTLAFLAAVNDNTAATLAGLSAGLRTGFDVGAATAALDAAPGAGFAGLTSGGSAVADAVTAGLEPVLSRIANNTSDTTLILEDVTKGELTINTLAAA